jgi:hypothetical protein
MEIHLWFYFVSSFNYMCLSDRSVNITHKELIDSHVNDTSAIKGAK